MKNKIYIHLAGNTLNSHEKFIKKLTKRGAKEVKKHEKSDVIIIFCPIVSRFETDINSALSSAPGLEAKKVVLVAMHHTFDEDYTLPNHRVLDNSAVTLFVDCLFFEKKGLLTCSRNKEAVKMVREELGLRRYMYSVCK